MSFEIISGDSASSLTSIIKDLCDNGYKLETIHCGSISSTSPLSSFEWFDYVSQELKDGAGVVAVLVGP